MIEIYKEDILEALAYEPLNIHKGGVSFYTSLDGQANAYTLSIQECSACAVGAILRRYLPGKTRVADIGAWKYIVGSTYMGYLSDYYESFRGTGMSRKEVRRHCIDFVEEYFPEDEVIVTLQGTEEETQTWLQL